MRYLFLFSLLFSHSGYAQITHELDVKEQIKTNDKKIATKEILHSASLNGLKKIAPEMGYNWDDFYSKLNEKFNKYFESYVEKKLNQKFGPDYKSALSDQERKLFLESLANEKHEAFINFAKTLTTIKTYSISQFKYEEGSSIWTAKVQIEFDKVKVQKLYNSILNSEDKAYSKIVIISEINLTNLTWTDLGLKMEQDFARPVVNSWINWFNENLPHTAEEAVVCDADCLIFYSKWVEADPNLLSIPPELINAVFVLVHIDLTRLDYRKGISESSFLWNGRVILHDVNTKRVLSSFTLENEKRTFTSLDQKQLNSSIASSVYRTPMSAFIKFNKRLEDSKTHSRQMSLTISGFKNLNDVFSYIQLLKVRGSSLGLEVNLESFSQDKAQLVCFYQGGEKRFMDLLSELKELKSLHTYTLVSDFSGAHKVIKFVAE